MAAAGAKIAVCGIPADGVNEVAASLRADGFEATGLPTDVADEKTAAKFGRLDIAVASAAVQFHDRDHTLHELDTEAWDLTHSINFRSTMLTCKYALQPMLPQQSGALEKTPNHDIHPDPEGRAQQLAESIPLDRPATPEDIAPWVTFLSSDEARYANGTHFLVDGGMSA